jgi:3-oxoacyl-[acyl-carrier-protein] synthase-1
LLAAETVCTGEGLSKALRGALEALPSGVKVDQVIGDLNGEPYRADELGFSAVRIAKQLSEPGRVIAPAASWGDVGAASAPLFAGLAVEAARRGYARGPSTLLFAGSEGGDRGAALVYSEPAIAGDEP